MIAAVARSALLTLFGILTSSASAAQAAECLAPVKTTIITAESRLACLAKAQIILPDSELPQLSMESIAKGYRDPTDSIQDSLVWCRFTSQDKLPELT